MSITEYSLGAVGRGVVNVSYSTRTPANQLRSETMASKMLFGAPH